MVTRDNQAAGQDRYEAARRAGAERLKARFDPSRLSALGVDIEPDGEIVCPCLRWLLGVRLEPLSMVFLPEGEPVDIGLQIIALDYLSADAPGTPLRFVSFADLAEARGYLKAFDGRVIQRLTRGAGRKKDEFVVCAERCGGVRGSDEPLSFLFHFFPRFEIQVVRYEGDEDFPPSCNVLFQDNAAEIMTVESIVVAADKLTSWLHGKSPVARR